MPLIQGVKHTKSILNVKIYCEPSLFLKIDVFISTYNHKLMGKIALYDRYLLNGGFELIIGSFWC